MPTLNEVIEQTQNKETFNSFEFKRDVIELLEEGIEPGEIMEHVRFYWEYLEDLGVSHPKAITFGYGYNGDDMYIKLSEDWT